VLSTSDTCIVRGDLSLINDGKMRFEQMENNDNKVEVGEQIVTSHISDKYLQGILIGYVSEVQVDSNNLTRSGYLTPVVNFKKLQEVLVITKTKAELTGTDVTQEDAGAAEPAGAEAGGDAGAGNEAGEGQPSGNEPADGQPAENGAGEGVPPESGAEDGAPPEDGADQGEPGGEGTQGAPPDAPSGAEAQSGAEGQ
ncbi:MAG: rod shape-determining protein MreC, partial [Schaedlerella sp.]|uniref:rod shape-determining protein MreC n=1 Tax=Schaedlerella sp. TaxID=2676057 RepID=UPI00352864BA